MTRCHYKNYIVFFVSFIFSIISRSADSDEITKFSVLTYNVQMRPLLDDNDYKAPRIGPKLNHFDIVALQESFAAKNELMAHCTLPCKSHFTDKRCCLNLVGSGLSTLSRFPVILTKKEHYRSSAGLSDVIASKGILLTRYLINGFNVDVYNTHMQATDDFGGHAARFDQARQLAQFVANNSPSAHSVIVLGDFNMSPLHIRLAHEEFSSVHYSDEKDMVLRTYAFSMMQETLGLSDLAITLHGDKSDCIDRILYRSGDGHTLQPIAMAKPFGFFTDEDNHPLSDGTPVLGEFSIKDAKKENNEGL